MATTEQYIGQRLLRKEDAKLLAGEGSYIDNQSMAGMVWMALVRPPFVHATIEAVDTAAAAAMPGVVAAYSAADLQGEWAAGLPMVWPKTEDIKVPTHYPLAADKVRFAGDAGAGRGRGGGRVGARERAPGGDRPRGRRERSRRHPRGPRYEQGDPLEPRRRRRSERVRHGPGDRAGALHPASPDPQRDRGARGPRPRAPCPRGGHAGGGPAD